MGSIAQQEPSLDPVAVGGEEINRLRSSLSPGIRLSNMRPAGQGSRRLGPAAPRASYGARSASRGCGSHNGSKIARKKVPASTCSLSPFVLPLLSPEPICCPRPPANGMSTSPMSGTAISSAGGRSPARRSRNSWAYLVITCWFAGADTRTAGNLSTRVPHLEQDNRCC